MIERGWLVSMAMSGRDPMAARLAAMCAEADPEWTGVNLIMGPERGPDSTLYEVLPSGRILTEADFEATEVETACGILPISDD